MVAGHQAEPGADTPRETTESVVPSAEPSICQFQLMVSAVTFQFQIG
jgi:hypothetical protein